MGDVEEEAKRKLRAAHPANQGTIRPCLICGIALQYENGNWYDKYGSTLATDDSHAHTPNMNVIVDDS